MQSNEKTLARTEKLDAEWNDIFSKYPVKSTQTNQKPESFKPDAYDIAVRELKFESRAQVYIVDCYLFSYSKYILMII